MVNRTFKRSYFLDSYFDNAEHKGLAINTDTMVEAARAAVNHLGIKIQEQNGIWSAKYPGKKKFESLPSGSDFGANLEALYQFGKYVIRGVQKEL